MSSYVDPDTETTTITVSFNEHSSHAFILKQLIESLVFVGFAPREEIEQEFEALLATGVYKDTIA